MQFITDTIRTLYPLWCAGGTSLHLAPVRAFLFSRVIFGGSHLASKESSYSRTNYRLGGKQLALLTIRQTIYFELPCAIYIGVSGSLPPRCVTRGGCTVLSYPVPGPTPHLCTACPVWYVTVRFVLLEMSQNRTSCV